MLQLELGLDRTNGASGVTTTDSLVPDAMGPFPIDPPRQEARTTPLSLDDWLGRRVGRRVQLVFTNNRTTMLSFGERRGILRVRLHEIFRRADATVWDAVCNYVGGQGRDTGRAIEEFIASCPRPRLAHPPEDCRTAGRFHDLRAIFDELNASYFHGAVQAAITWGGASPRRYRRTIQLGLYIRNDALIRIHPSLDQAFVPHNYVGWVVFHEMLHDVFGIDATRRRKVHPPEFAAVEQTYPHYAQCKEWEQKNLYRLLRYRRQG